MNFWSELKRRSVVRVGGVYAIVGWLLVQIAVALEAAMALPSWFDGMIVAVLLLGFPIALIITWAFELTPEGVRRTTPAPADAAHPPLATMDALFLAAMAAVLAISVYQVLRPPVASVVPAPGAIASSEDPGPAAAPDASIAVLPFINLSSDPEQEYFSDGLADQLMNQLAQIEGLKVAGRTSAFAFKGQNPNFQEIGATLGVATVLEGSVQKSDGRIRVIAQLVNAEDGFHLWSETYNRDLDDVFAIQDEISMAVADALSVTLGVAHETFDYGGTAIFEAYDHVLRARALYAQPSPSNQEAASRELRAAIAIDPEYGVAWAELARSLSLERAFSPDLASQLDPERAQAVERALGLAPDLPLAWAARSWLAGDQGDWIVNDSACDRVFALPADPDAQGVCGGGMTLTGRVRAALPYREAAMRSDPLSLNYSATLVRQYALLGMGDALTREYERSKGLPGRRYSVESPVAYHLMGSGAPREEVVAQYGRVCATPGAPVYCARLLEVLAEPEERAADSLAAVHAEVLSEMPALGYDVAIVEAYLGETDPALESLEAFAAATSAPLYQHLWYPVLSEVRADPRFKDIVRDIGFVALWRATDDWADSCRPLGADDFECF